jgi:preprotein translocase subunit SecY
VPDLKKRILYTLGIVALYRVGAHIPTPFIDPDRLAEHVEQTRQGLAGGLFNAVDLFSGKAFTKMSIMALGIMPYISVSIIIQLLTVVFPRLQKMMQEGVLGQRKINRMTRKWTIVLAAFQSFGLATYINQQNLTYLTGAMLPVFYFTTVVAMTERPS